MHRHGNLSEFQDVSPFPARSLMHPKYPEDHLHGFHLSPLPEPVQELLRQRRIKSKFSACPSYQIRKRSNYQADKRKKQNVYFIFSLFQSAIGIGIFEYMANATLKLFHSIFNDFSSFMPDWNPIYYFNHLISHFPMF